jgi:hypothetical protein
MHTPIRTVVLGLLLALGATSARAQVAKVAEAPATAAPAAAEAAPPIDLSLHPTSPASAFANPLLPPVATLPPTPAASAPVPAALPPAAPVDPLQSASAEVKSVARWVLDSRDNGGLPFLLIDKVNARVFAFSPAGQYRGDAPVLLGMTPGDRLLAPNSAAMAQMGPQERVTPAGRFVSRLAIDSHGNELLVLDYAASISLHPVVKGTPEEHRAERLASPTSQDNRISFGCINVPPAFYATYVSPAFARTKGIVYVLPETSPASALFGMPAVGTVVSGAQPGAASLEARAVPAVPAVGQATAGPGAQN